MKRREPTPKGFTYNLWYEQVEFIMRNEPKRFFLFTPQTKTALAVYLEMKRRHEELRVAA
jgi:hypothetical protein